MKKEKFWKGVKTAVGDIEHAGGYTNFRVYANVKTGEVWACLYLDCNSYELYNNSNIIQVKAGTCGCSILGRTEITQKSLLADCENAKAENEEENERRKNDEENARIAEEAYNAQRDEYEAYVREHGTDRGF